MKIIFLDVDGVLNSVESMLVFGTYNTFDPVRVGLVQRLAQEGGAKIVISSSWRTGNLDNTKATLRRSGAGMLTDTGLVIGETSLHHYLPDGIRGRQIKAWLDDHPEVTEYVILDDDSDMLEGQNFVKTDIASGFGLREYLAALKFLTPEHKDLKSRVGLHRIIQTSGRTAWDATFRALEDL